MAFILNMVAFWVLLLRVSIRVLIAVVITHCVVSISTAVIYLGKEIFFITAVIIQGFQVVGRCLQG